MRTTARFSTLAVATGLLVVVAVASTVPLAWAKPQMPSWGSRYVGQSTKGVVTKEKVVAITIDDGPTAATKKVVGILDSYGARGTFFFIKNRYKGDPSWVLSASQHGHEIGNHGATHTPLQGRTPEILRSQITDDDDWIAQLTGSEPLWVRPSGGFIDVGGRAAIADTGHLLGLWTIDSQDSHGGSVNYTSDAVFRHATTGVRPGSIILMHQTHDWSVAALPRICAWLRANGYRMVTLSELAASGSPGTPVGAAISSTSADLAKYSATLGLGPVAYTPTSAGPAPAPVVDPQANVVAAAPAAVVATKSVGSSAATATARGTGLIPGVPSWLMWVLVVVGVLQLLVQAVCLYGIWTLRAEHLRGGRKWPWVLVVIFGGLIGSAIYILAARRPVPPRQRPSSSDEGPRPSRTRGDQPQSASRGHSSGAVQPSADDWGYYDPERGE